ETRPPLQPLVAGGLRRLDRLPEDGIGLRQLADLGQGGGQVGYELQASAVRLRQQLGSPAQQVDRSGHVATRERPRSSCLQPLGRPLCERSRLFINGTKLDAVAMGLSEVVAEDLVQL